MRALPGPSRRITQIDVLKGIAMVMVICLHALPAHELFDSAALLWLGQAVPIFVVVMGINGTLSLMRSNAVRLRELYPPGYARSRIERLWLPFAVLFCAAMVVAIARGTASPRQLSGLVTGVLPIAGPGNYFVTFSFQFAVCFPIIYACFRRSLAASVAAAFAINIAFEVAAGHMALLENNPYYYVSSILHWLPFVAVGGVLAYFMAAERRLPAWWWLAGAASAAYLVAVNVDATVFPWSVPGWREWGETFAGAPYAGAVVAAGLLWLPARDFGLVHQVALIGRRSYEIFLFQIFWFAVVPERSIPMVAVDLVVCLVVGSLASVGWSRLLARQPVRAAVGPARG